MVANSLRSRTLDRARLAAWEDAIREPVEDLLAVLPGIFSEAATAVLAYELARVYSPPERRTRAERPDDWAAALSPHVEGLFPDAGDAAAATAHLAGRMALEFEPPGRVRSR